MTEAAPLLDTAFGTVRGQWIATGAQAVARFLGVPYAAAPVGGLRLRPPLAPEPWGATRDATRFGLAPMQSRRNPFAGVLPADDVGPSSEDCLTLNIWAPADPPDRRRPIMAFVPGGAFLVGGSAAPTFDGARLAATGDVVVATINYRLGAFGFLWLDGLANPAEHANLGLKDVAAALRWLAQHASELGGDPGNLTAFGESAGAGALLHLLATDQPPLVRRMILQSPGVHHTLRPDDAARVTHGVLAHLGLPADDLRRLQEVPADLLLDAQERTVLETLTTVSTMPFHPVVDGEMVTDMPAVTMARGTGWPVDLLVTWTRDELRLFPDRGADRLDDAGLLARLRRLLARRLGQDPGPARAEALLAAYRGPLGYEDAGGAALWAAITTDSHMRLPIEQLATEHSRHGHPTRVGEFAWAARRTDRGWAPGAFHAIDLPFTFGTFDVGGWAEFLGADADARRLSERQMAAWTSFARDGDGATVGGTPWPAYDADRLTVVLDTPACDIRRDPLAEVRAAWAGLWSPQGRPPVADTDEPPVSAP